MLKIIAFLMSRWPVDGGIETVTRTLANEMAARGHHVVVLFTDKSPDKADMPFVDSRIESILIPKDKPYEEQQAFVCQSLTDRHADVVINQCYPTWSASLLEELKGKMKIVECMHMALFFPTRYHRLTWHGYDLKMRLCGPWVFRYIEKRQRCETLEREFPYVDKFIFLSKSLVDEYLRFRGHRYEQGKLTYMNNPLAQNVVLTEEDFRQKENVVLCVARMSEKEKRISLMIRLWREIERDARFNDWRFDIVGDGPSLNDYKQLANDLGLQHVIFHGYQNPMHYYMRSKISLMTSVTEGWGMTIVESQQCGVVPIVLETFSSVHDLITDGENGRIVKKERQFLNCMKETMSETHKREMMAKEGMRSCRKFLVGEIVDQWEALLESI